MTVPASLTTPPLHPGAGQARGWLLHELSKPAYNDSGPSFIERIGATINDFLHKVVTGVNVPIGPAGAIVLGLIVAAIAASAIWWAGRPSSRRRSGTRGIFEPGAPPASAASYRLSAEESARRGEWKTAVVFRFRALARALEERTIIDPQPGRTAHEVGAQSAAALPDLADDLQRAAMIFDGVYFGGRLPTQGDYTVIGAADDAARRARPVFASAP